MVDAVKSDRLLLESKKEIPKSVPTRNQYQAIAKAHRKMEEVFADAEKEYTREGKDDKAVALRAEFANLDAEQLGTADVGVEVESLTQAIRKVAWSGKYGITVFREDGTIVNENGVGNARWAAMNGSTVLVMLPSGYVDKYVFNSERTKFAAYAIGGGNSRPSWEATRRN